MNVGESKQIRSVSNAIHLSMAMAIPIKPSEFLTQGLYSVSCYGSMLSAALDNGAAK